MEAACADIREERPRINRRFFLRVITGLIAAAACVAGCGKGGPMVGRESVKKVITVENNVEALGAWAKDGTRVSALVHIDYLDDMAVFPAALMGDLENAARQLRRREVKVLEQIAPMIERGGTVSLGYMAGMYKRVIWVIPSTRPVSERPVDVFRNFLVTRRKFSEGALSDFKADGTNITGSIAGVPLTITRLADLTLDPGENAVIDLDLHYFPVMKLENPEYRTGTKALLEFLRELGSRKVRANLVTVNLSTRNSMAPMDLRYYGDVIREALMNPEDLNGPIPNAWRYMIEAEDSIAAGRYASAAALYEDLTTTVKDKAGIYFWLAIARGYQDKGPECRAALLEAYGLDGEYFKGFSQLARVLAAANKVEAGRYILDTPDLVKSMGPVEMDYELGVFYYTAHKQSDATVYLMRVGQQRPKDFGVFTILYRAYRELGDNQGQVYSLQRLIEIDEGRVKREMPWVYANLGTLYDRAANYPDAGQMYEKYMQVKPGDSLSAVFQKRIDTWKAKKLIIP